MLIEWVDKLTLILTWKGLSIFYNDVILQRLMVFYSSYSFFLSFIALATDCVVIFWMSSSSILFLMFFLFLPLTFDLLIWVVGVCILQMMFLFCPQIRFDNLVGFDALITNCVWFLTHYCIRWERGCFMSGLWVVWTTRLHSNRFNTNKKC